MPRLACLLVLLPALAALNAQDLGPTSAQDKPGDQAEELQTVEFTARIVDSAGQPIEDAGLALFKSSESKDSYRCRTTPAAKSGADGKIALTIKRAANDRRSWLLAAKKRTALVLRVRPTKTTRAGGEIYRADLGDVVLHDGVSVLGLIRNRDGKPVPGAQVTASGVLSQMLVNRRASNTHSTTCYGVADAQGRVRLAGIPKFGVSVKVTAKGYYSWSTDYLNRHTPLVATLEPGGQVSGVVLGRDGKPLEGARVYAYSEAAASSAGQTTGNDGKFTIDLPGRGRFRLRYYARLDEGTGYTYEYSKILTQPRQDMRLRFGTGALDNRGNPIAKVEAKPASAAKTAKQRDKGKVVLRIVDAKSGIALRKARAAAMWWPPNNWQHNPGYLKRQLDNKKKDTDLDERGTLRLAGPRQGQPDTGRIIVAAKGYAPSIVKDVDWEEDGKNEHRVKMHKESAVSGVVVDPKTGAPLAGVKVIAVTDPALLRHYNPQPVRRKLDGTRGAVTTDDNGAFRIGELADGNVQIYLAHPKRADVPPVPVEIEPAASVKGLRLEYPKGGSLRGKIVGTKLRPGWRVRVRRMPQARNHFGSTYGLSENQQYEAAKVSADGSFVFHGLSRANYLLSLVMLHPQGALEIPMDPIRMRTKSFERSFDVSEDLPGRLRGRVKLEGAVFTPGRLILLVQDTKRINPYNSFPGRANLQGEFAMLDPRGHFDLPLSEGQYYVQVVDLMTKLILFQGTRAVGVRPNLTTEHDLVVGVAPVDVELKPEQAGAPLHITKIEIVPEHPKPPQTRNVGIVFGGMGIGNRYSGTGMRIAPGESKVQLLLPAVPCKLLARSDAHNLDPKVNQYNFPAQGEAEITPVSGQSNKVEIKVGPPQINLDDDKPGDKKAGGGAAGAVNIIRRR